MTPPPSLTPIIGAEGTPIRALVIRAREEQEIWDPSCPLFGVTRPGIGDQPTVDSFGALTAAFIG